jgi:hypothetical protein
VARCCGLQSLVPARLPVGRAPACGCMARKRNWLRESYLASSRTPRGRPTLMSRAPFLQGGPPTHVTVFHGHAPPAISVRAYLERIKNFGGCSPCCFVLALNYMDKLEVVSPDRRHAPLACCPGLARRPASAGSSRACLVLRIPHFSASQAVQPNPLFSLLLPLLLMLLHTRAGD